MKFMFAPIPISQNSLPDASTSLADHETRFETELERIKGYYRILHFTFDSQDAYTVTILNRNPIIL
jgi:hypothetical protein